MRPLEDLRILCVEQFVAGPFGSMVLAELGADVIKIEDARLGGDVARYVPPLQQGQDSVYFEAFNRNKRSIALDLTTPAGRDVFRRLAAHADAVYSNLRGDVPERLGLTYAQLADVNPRIVCVSLSGYGTTGPRRAEPAYDYILQGMAGWMALTGEPGGPPAKSGLSLVDFCGGLVAGQSLLAGVHAARRDGVGTDCDVSLFETAMAMLTYPAAWQLTGGIEPTRRAHSAHPSLVPFQNFATSDGWIVAGGSKEKFFRGMVAALGIPDLADDPRFADFPSRRENESVLLPILAQAFATRTTAEWIKELGAAGVPCGPVNTVEDALDDPQTHARGLLLEVDHPDLGRVRQVAGPVRVGERPSEHRRAPKLGEHTREVLTELLGTTPEELATLSQSGAFGPDTP
ncbi:CaiB/BaiF CoA-transferase family protein [Pseudonocardia ailaonensis]|uniref:CaiB/BaiF CoA-transferase family protein n=1 Tax=Pseudonocardia ailaonensis TaxID=367279 RepID=A0ABN2NFJ7_9PSEU